MQAPQRRVLPTWEEIKDTSPSGHSLLKGFPPEEMALLRGIVDHQAWDFARKWFDTGHIHFRAGCMLARYPGFKGGGTGSDAANLHIDNGNNSLLPQTESLRQFGQLVFGCISRMWQKTKPHCACSPNPTDATCPNVSLWYAKAAPCVFSQTTHSTQPVITCAKTASASPGVSVLDVQTTIGKDLATTRIKESTLFSENS